MPGSPRNASETSTPTTTPTALAWVTRLAEDLQEERLSEVRSLGARWRHKIAAWHASGITNAATEGATT